MGRYLAALIALIISHSSNADDLSGLASLSNVSQDRLIAYVKSGMAEFSGDQIVQGCKVKLSNGDQKAVYALFNYILFLDKQSTMSKLKMVRLKEAKEMILISEYAKKSIKYCAPETA